MCRKTISILKERIPGERRVILTPREVSMLIDDGFEVLAEHDCGIECGYHDNEYHEAGAAIVDQITAWTHGGLILKYKGPIESEYSFLTPTTILAALYHAEGSRQLLKAMVSSKMTGYSFEFFETDDGLFPLAFPGGEIAGKSAVLYAAHYLQSQHGGMGRMLCDIIGTERPTVGIIGYGSVGRASAALASALGNRVIVFGRNVAEMRKLQICMGSEVIFVESNQQNFARLLPELDVLIGAILISSYETTPLVTYEMVSKMKKGTVIIDVTCGYGEGYMPFIKKQTTHSNPIYLDDGRIYIKIDNLPAAYHLTTTQAYSKNLYPYARSLAKNIFYGLSDPTSMRAMICKDGSLVHHVVRSHWDYYENNRL